jgi:hypothetical protein
MEGFSTPNLAKPRAHEAKILHNFLKPKKLLCRLKKTLMPYKM